MPPPVHPAVRPRGTWPVLAVIAVALGCPAAGSGTAERDKPLLAFAINAHHISDLPLYLDSVDAIGETGANALVVVTPMFQDRVDSSRIRFHPDRCPTDDQLAAILARARLRGLHTTLLPIVLIEFPREKDWRGLIRPDDPDAWWASYEQFIDRFLDIARAGDVDVLSVGSELNSTESAFDRWRHIIERVRSRFTGQVTYTANWDHFDAVSFWPLLDFVSISAYFELAREEPDAPVARLAESWATQRGRLLRFARARELPVMLMELGYPSLPWAAAHPWNYVADDEVKADHEAQARCFSAFFEAWDQTLARPESPALGVCCYLWDPYHHGGDDDTGYGVQGKPALEIIQNAFRRISSAAAQRD